MDAQGFTKDFHVITMISNTVRYESRYRLYKEFAARMEAAGVNLWTCEVAFGERPFEVTDANNPRHLQLRTIDEIWHKERALNLLVNRVTENYPDWKYLAWIDADIRFQNDHHWIKETVHALQHWEVVQMFSQAVDMGPNGEYIGVHQGFMYNYCQGKTITTGYKDSGHPGFAYAITRRAYEAVPFIDYAILGSGDRHMACGWVGQIEKSLSMSMQHPYLRELVDWQNQAERYVRRDVGYVPGMILHFWHGRKKDRGYQSRWKILAECEFNPDTDIRPDAYGLYRLVDHGDPRSIELRDRIRRYFRSRNEDSIDLF